MIAYAYASAAVLGFWAMVIGIAWLADKYED